MFILAGQSHSCSPHAFRLVQVWFILFFVFFAAILFQRGQAALAASPDQSGQIWQVVAPGLDFGEFTPTDSDTTVAALRIDPEYFDFRLCMASEDEQGPASLKDWASRRNLDAAINASMYLPDNSTSTGYMRSGNHVNNSRIVGRFGAFFVAGARKDGIPRARIIDRDDPAWKQVLDDYDLVIQNYRMINSRRHILWSSGGPNYAISAIAEDGSGKILFLHSRTPMEAHEFARLLLDLPLDVRTVMYVEGGAQAGLMVNTGGLKKELVGAHAHSFLVTGNLRAILPNVLGIRQRSLQNNNSGTQLH